jgi:alkane 1-monooxygenase
MHRLVNLAGSLAPHIVITGFIIALLNDLPGLYIALSVFFLLAFIADLFRFEITRGSIEAMPTPRPHLYQIAVHTYPLLYAVLLTVAAYRLSSGEIRLLEMPSLTIHVAMVGGVFAICAAHELMHRSSAASKHLALATLFLCSYPHFALVHNSVHHVRVATPADPGSARVGESVYGFFLKNLCRGPLEAIRSERQAASGAAAPILRRINIVWIFALLAGWYILLYLSLGHVVALFFLCQGIIAVFVLETVNYMQHYGLTRGMTNSGVYESVGPEHSWESNHPVCNWLLFNLPHHSHHHIHSRVSYEQLRAAQNAPKLPFGYFVMFWIALCPQVWRYVMDHRIPDERPGEFIAEQPW